MMRLCIKNCRGIAGFVAVAMATSGMAFGASAVAPAAAAGGGGHAAAAPAAAPAARSAPAAAPAQSTPAASNAGHSPQSQQPSPALQHANEVTRSARANAQARYDNVNHYRNGSAYLIPGYYGPDFWAGGYNGWYGYGPYNNTQYYGQFEQNDQNANNTNSNSNATSNADTTPAFYEPPVQAAREAAGASPDSPAMMAALKANPDYQKADVTFRAAEQEYSAARKRVIEKLKQDPQYQDAVNKKSSEASKLSAIKVADKGTTPEQVAPVAEQKLDAAKTMTDLEQQAMLNDPQASAAKAKLDDAVAQRTAIRAQVESSMVKPK